MAENERNDYGMDKLSVRAVTELESAIKNFTATCSDLSATTTNRLRIAGSEESYLILKQMRLSAADVRKKETGKAIKSLSRAS